MFVTAALLDLLDSSNEPFDRFCAAGTGIDRIVFEIFDRELDIGRNPSLQNFADAWKNRGLDLPQLVTTFGGSSIPVTAPPPPPQVHYDSQPAANLAVWRPSQAQWWVIGGASGRVPVWGEPADIPVPADYDGDGLTDLAIWRPRDGNWWVLLSGSGVVQTTQWGTQGDVPLPADYDGDREVDFAVYRPSDETVYIHSDNCGPHQARRIGKGTPVAGRFTSDAWALPAIYDPSSGFTVHIRLASGGWSTQTIGIVAATEPPAKLAAAGTGNVRSPGLRFDPGQLATTTGTLQRMPQLSVYEAPRPVIGDYDGDGRSDAAVYAPQSGMWSVRRTTAGVVTQQWGTAGDIPVPADYDADGLTDFAVWRPSTGEWWILHANGQQRIQQWGTNGDVPVPAR
jgi:hypothetical protein